MGVGWQWLYYYLERAGNFPKVMQPILAKLGEPGSLIGHSWEASYLAVFFYFSSRSQLRMMGQLPMESAPSLNPLVQTPRLLRKRI